MKHPRSSIRGFTLIEMIVVVAIIALITAALAGAYGKVIQKSSKKNASETCVQLAQAWSVFHQRLRYWPTEVQSKKGRFEMDYDFCELIGKNGFFDVSYRGSKTQKQIENDPVLEIGMLSPIGLKLYDEDSKSEAKKHLYQVCVDINEDGIIDSADGAPSGVKVRGEAIVWCYDTIIEKDKPDHFFARSW